MHALAQAGMDDLHGVPRPDVVADRSGWLLTQVPSQALARDTSLLQGLSLHDEARLMAFRTNGAIDAETSVRAPRLPSV